MKRACLSVLLPSLLGLTLASNASASALEWSEVVAQPQSVVELAITPAAPGVVMAAGDRLYRSLDGGTKWEVVQGLTGPITAVGVSPVAQQVVLCATANGVYHSSDGGHAWTGAAGLPPEPVLALEGAPDSASVAYAGLIQHGVWRSADAGATWQRAGKSPDLPVHAIQVDPAHPTRVLAATDRGLLSTADGGTTWTLLQVGISGTRVLSLSMDFVGNQGFAGTSAGLFRTQDGGSSWEAIGGPGAPSGPVTSAAMHTHSGSEVAAGGSQGVVTSVDGGNTWQPTPGWPASTDASALVYLYLLEPVVLGAPKAEPGIYRFGEPVSLGVGPQTFPSPTLTPGGGKAHVDRSTNPDDIDPVWYYLGGAAILIFAGGLGLYWWRRRFYL
ncbi:MAG: WD40/YVTN/BNR-like repeat-containing protein [Candidatus Dormibacteria bacterium]